jgi:uncharacterized protein
MIRKLLVFVGVVSISLVATVGVAFAHVEIERDGDVKADGTVAATLSVPNEEADAGTVKVELVFPESPEITAAIAEPVTGWTATVQKSGTGAVTQITWTGGPLTGDQRVELPLTLGPVPADTTTIDFKAVQTYDNGDVVRWIEPTPVGGEEPEHPAPVLTVRGAAASEDDHGGAATTTTAHDDSEHDDGLSTGAIVAIVVGGLIVGGGIGYAIARSRKRA